MHAVDLGQNLLDLYLSLRLALAKKNQASHSGLRIQDTALLVRVQKGISHRHCPRMLDQHVIV